MEAKITSEVHKDLEAVHITPMERMIVKLYNAATSGDVAALEETRNQKIDVFALVFHGGNNALHISAFYGRKDFMERLLHLVNENSDDEADQRTRGFLRAQNEEGNNALHEAVRGAGDAEIVKALIKADEELAGVCNKKLQTSLHYALFYRKYDLADEIIEKCPQLCKEKYSPGKNLLDLAAFHGCPVSIVEKLVECYYHSSDGGEVNQKTALHVAAAHGHVAVVRSILRSATNCMEIRDQVGRTALHCAVENAQIQVVIILVKAMGMVINRADDSGYTALDIANQKYEKEPLSPYFAIQFFLRRMNAVEGMEGANKTRETSKPDTCEWYSKRLNILSVFAIFIATVTFQAAFTVPHPFEGNKHPDPLTMSMLSAPMSTVVYRALGVSGIFLIFDALAFGLSVVTIIILAYVHIFCRYRSCLVIVVAIILPLALNMMIDAFSFAILIQLGSERHVVASIINYAMVVMGLLLSVGLPIVVLYVLGIFWLLIPARLL